MASASGSNARHTQNNLMILPRELRDLIYKLAIVTSGPLYHESKLIYREYIGMDSRTKVEEGRKKLFTFKALILALASVPQLTLEVNEAFFHWNTFLILAERVSQNLSPTSGLLADGMHFGIMERIEKVKFDISINCQHRQHPSYVTTALCTFVACPKLSELTVCVNDRAFCNRSGVFSYTIASIAKVCRELDKKLSNGVNIRQGYFDGGIHWQEHDITWLLQNQACTDYSDYEITMEALRLREIQ